MKHVHLLPLSGLVSLFLFASTSQAGYTHYFTWHKQPDEDKLKECLARMGQVVKAATKIVAGPDGEGDPSIGPLQLEFNGKGEEDAHEPFVFPGQVGSNFCKTNYKPYDAVVTACLLVVRDHFSGDVLEIASDGDWNEGAWADGQALYRQVFGKPAGNPMGRNVLGGGESETWLLLLVLAGVVAAVFLWKPWNRSYMV
jgi:hypothetical protein